MVRLRRGRVLSITGERADVLELDVEVDGRTAPAVAYPSLTGPVGPGDAVVLNTTAVALGLGTGGVHFVVAVEGGTDAELTEGSGRIMKARYTPLQTAVRSVEESHTDLLERSRGLEDLPVVVAPLHSMIGPVAAGAKAAGATRVAYVMSDGASLPGRFSRLVGRLREAGLLDGFVTCGQAFGGDLEAVTAWTGLLAAKEILHADVIVVADGPGNTGTSTTWGVSALAGGHTMNAAASLGGRPVAALRVSFVETRDRHRTLSHHSITILSEVCLVRVDVAVPSLAEPQREELWRALRGSGLDRRHRLVEVGGGPGLEVLSRHGIDVESMGRTARDDPAFFLAAGAAGVLAGRMSSGGPASDPAKQSP